MAPPIRDVAKQAEGCPSTVSPSLAGSHPLHPATLSSVLPPFLSTSSLAPFVAQLDLPRPLRAVAASAREAAHLLIALVQGKVRSPSPVGRALLRAEALPRRADYGGANAFVSWGHSRPPE